MTLISLADWAQPHGLDTGNSRRYAEQGRIPGARRIGRDWLVPEHAPLLPNKADLYLLPRSEVTPGQRRVREIVQAHLPHYLDLGQPNVSLYDTPEHRELVDAMRRDLHHDAVVRSDAVTGLNLDQPRISRALLTAEWQARRDQHRVVKDVWVDVPVTHILDVSHRTQHNDTLLGDKWPSTIGALLAMGAGQTITNWQLDVTIYPGPGIVHVTSGGAHRSLAALLYGQAGLKVERATLVPGPINATLNEMAVRAEVFAPTVTLEMRREDDIVLMTLDRRLSLHRERADRDTPLASRYDLVQEYLDWQAGGRYFPQTPGQLLAQFEGLDEYLEALDRRGLLMRVREALQHPVVDQLTLPEPQSPIARWYRFRLEEETHQRRDRE